MKILSASQDFEQVSLSGFPSVLEKLVYLAGLRRENGDYAHWGLAKVYGEQVAGAAIAAAHGRLYSDCLSSPLERLATEISSAALEQALSPEAYVERVEVNRKRLVPQITRSGSAKHLDAVLLALKKIARTGRLEVRRSA